MIKTYGLKYGVCNICGESGPLTEDHTPPKGCIKLGQGTIRHIAGHLDAEPVTKSEHRKFQNGVKYRTLCKRCNNSLLGAKYDPELINFVNQLTAPLKSYKPLPQVLRISGKPQCIARAILGHICAQGVDRYEKGPHTKQLRDYLLDESEPLPDFVEIYYWLYPYQAQILIRDAAWMSLSHQEPVVMWLFKFFPIAFFVAWDQPTSYAFRLPSFSNWKNLTIRDEVYIPVVLDSFPPQHWPEAPTKDSLILYGEEAIAAYLKVE